MSLKDRLSITDVAKSLGVTARTIMRWEKSGKIKHSKRDWRGWRFYHREDVEEIGKFYESSYEHDELIRPANGIVKAALAIIFATSWFLSSLIVCASAYADSNQAPAITETESSVNINLSALPVMDGAPATVEEGVRYTLGPDDVIEIEVRRHPEFSGKYTINAEGKIEYKYIGDIIVSGLTKRQAKERLTKIVSEYVIDPEVNVRIDSYMSKTFYVVGEVVRPGRFYMKGDSVTVRKAIVQAGLPTLGAAMRKCRLITPNQTGTNNFVYVNVYKLLYGGDLSNNLIMKPGDVLYIPSTVMAKIIHVISPVTSVVGQAATTTTQGAAAAAVMAP